MFPADQIYATAARLRRALDSRPGRQRRLARPVVSIGNLAVGGSGKTPLTMHVARLLAAAGERPAILSRGYARTDPDTGVTVVSDGARLRADLARAGDEPLLLARQLRGIPVLVCPDRYLAGRLAERHLGATVHVLDDGFQHLTLWREVDLLIVDREDLARPRTLPGGRLREPVSAARAAHALLVAGEGEQDPAAIAARLGAGAGFTLVREVEPPVEETLQGPRPIEPGLSALAVCGIARPDRFFAESAGAGLEIAGTMAFPDHHPYTAADVARIAAELGTRGAGMVLTTAKDHVRLLPLRPLPFRVAVRPMSVRVEPAEAFEAWLAERLAAARDQARPGDAGSPGAAA